MNPRQTIIDFYPQLTPELQRAADFTLSHTHDVITLSMRAFATLAQVKPATLLRLAQRVGFSGWVELKNSFIVSVGFQHESYGVRAGRLVEKGEGDRLYDEVFNTHHANLERTSEENRESLTAAVDLMESAQHVYICGFRASFPIAWSVYYVYRLFKKQVSLIDGFASNDEMFTREIGPDDVLVIIGFAPYSRESLRVLEAARQIGARVVALTDTPASPLAAGATASLWFSTDSPSFFPSVIAGMGLAECLLASLVARQGDDAVARIKRVEEFMVKAGAYAVPAKSEDV
ncbi:MurR/RpiR family transcriptional regulator [Entomohabitans teleogrylli]|uniref:MurR/RpiR family transcriptional regulator n=1 Tax=Entomohabitans teleogrylli TaxID=1384589 RepID=UPI00073D42C6|nr:MurR/RpiR family transcriptional regulator [Entomohabitans teleogrylli]